MKQCRGVRWRCAAGVCGPAGMQLQGREGESQGEVDMVMAHAPHCARDAPGGWWREGYHIRRGVVLAAQGGTRGREEFRAPHPFGGFRWWCIRPRATCDVPMLPVRSQLLSAPTECAPLILLHPIAPQVTKERCFDGNMLSVSCSTGIF